MKSIVFALAMAVLFCSGCATAVPPLKVREQDDRYGYTIASLPLRDSYIIASVLPKGMLDDEYRWYVNAAVGRTCKQLGFDYYDTSLRTILRENRNTYYEETDAYCFSDQKLYGLAIRFKYADKNPYNAIIQVSDFQKDRSFLKIGDYIVMVNNVLIGRHTDLMRAVYEAVNLKKKSIPLDIIRDGKQMHFDEPISKTSYDAFGPKNLKNFEAWLGAKRL